MKKYANLTLDKIETLIDKIGGVERVEKFLRGELILSDQKQTEFDGKMYKKNSTTYLSFTSDGTSGKDWIKRLKSKGVKIDSVARGVLLSKDFNFTKGINYNIPIPTLSDIGSKTEEDFKTYAKKHKFSVPNAETACLTCETLLNIGLDKVDFFCIITFHNPIISENQFPFNFLLTIINTKNELTLSVTYGDLSGLEEIDSDDLKSKCGVIFVDKN